MLFDRYNFFIEKVINLDKYYTDGESIEDFIDNFINKIEKGSFFGFLFGSTKKSLVEELKEKGISQVLLVFSNKFIKKLEDIYLSGGQIKLVAFGEYFSSEIVNHFEANGIECSVVTNKLHFKTDYLEQWLNINYLKEIIETTDNEAYLLGIKGNQEVQNQESYKPISLSLKSTTVALELNKPIFLGSNDLFKTKVDNSDDKIAQVVYIKHEENPYLVFNTEGFTTISSDNSYLSDTFFNDKRIDYFYLPKSELDKSDIVIYFEQTPVILSSIVMKNNNKESKKTEINKSAKYLIELVQFSIPIDKKLKNLQLYVVNIEGQQILAAANRLPKGVSALGKLKIDPETKEIIYINESRFTQKFELLSDNSGVYKVENISNNNFTKTTDTDDEESINKSTLVTITPGTAEKFFNKLVFLNSSVTIYDEKITIEYANFKIGSFAKELKLHRNTLRYFQDGTIIDIHSDHQYGGRIFFDDSSKIVGTLLSTTPLTLKTQDDKNWQLINSIDSKVKFNVIFKTSTNKITLKKGESATLSSEELFNNEALISIERGGIEVISVRIIPLINN